MRKWAISKILPLFVKKLAEGDFGTAPAHAYIWLAGKKTWTAIILAAVYAALINLDAYRLCPADPATGFTVCHAYAGYLWDAAKALLAFGLYDGAIRMAPPDLTIVKPSLAAEEDDR